MNERKFGVILSYFSIVIGILIALVFTPFLLKTLGKEQYGLFILASSFVAYLSILDMGMNDSIVRFLVKYRINGEHAEESNFLANMMLFYGLITLLVLLSGGAVYLNLELLFENSFSHADLITFKDMFGLVVLSVAISIFFNPITATLIASEKFIFIKTLEIISYLLTTLLMFVFLIYGYSTYAMLVISVSVTLSVVLFKVLFSFFWLKIKIKLISFSYSKLIGVLKYAAPIFVVVIVEQIYWKLDNIILGSILGPALVTVYAIGLMFHKYFMSFATAISRVMLPKVVKDVEGGADSKELTKLLTKVSRIQAFVVLLILSGFILFGLEFINLWIGPEYQDAYYVMLFVMIPYSLELMGNLRNTILQAKGLYWYRSTIIFVLSILNIVLTIYLIDIWGITGAAASTGLGVLLGYIAVNMVMSYKQVINVRDYLYGLAKGIAFAFALTLSFGYLITLIPLIGWFGLIVKVFLHIILSLFIFYFVALNADEKNMINQIIKHRRKKYLAVT
jgi:O-antigen/teichoic acid export membrane protein